MHGEEQTQTPAEAARTLAERLAHDVQLAATRVEHVRLTARAHEAARLADSLERAETAERTETD